jgi:polyphosphate glucokinase
MSKHSESQERLVLGLDIGGSAIKYGLVNIDTGAVCSEANSRPVEEPFDPAALTEAVRLCLQDHHWSGPMGVGYPGVVKNGVPYTAAHVHDSFVGVNWLGILRELTDGPVALLNDADAAGMAEMRFGAGAQRVPTANGTVLVITLGTGIGSAVFNAGRLLPNTEFGHMLLGDKEAEELAAGSIKVRENLNWEAYGLRLSRFLTEMERLLSTDLIIIGGGISENFAQFEPYLNLKTKTVPAYFRNRAGLIGAALAVTADNHRR